MNKSQPYQISKWIKMLPLLILMLVFLNTAKAQFGGGSVFVVGNQITADTCNKTTGSFSVVSGVGSNMYSILFVTNQDGIPILPSLNDPNLFENLPAGTYNISPTPVDFSDLAMNSTVTIDLVDPLQSGSSINLPTCTANGIITLNPSNGTAPYTFLWSNTATSSSISLPVGVYNRNVRIMDVTGCILNEQFTINVPSTVNLNPQVIQPTCSVNGSIILNATGSAPFSYLWSNNATTATMNTSAGTYILSVIVTGNDGCTQTDLFNIETNQNPNVVINGCGNYIYNGINYSQTSIVTENFSQSGCIENRTTHINIFQNNVHQLSASNNVFNCIDSSLLTISGNNDNHIQNINWFENGVSIANVPQNNLVTVAGGNGVGNALNQLGSHPRNVVFDNAGYMYVADFSNSRILKYPPSSTSASNGVVVAGGNGAGNALNQLSWPTGLFIKGNILYVADQQNGRVMKYPTNPPNNNGLGVIAVKDGLDFFSSKDVFVNANDEIYVSELHSHRVVKYPANSNEFTPGLVVAGSTAGNLTTNTSVVATSGSALNQLDGASGIWVKPNGDLYVVEFYNLRVTKWTSGATSGIIVAGGNGWGNALNQLSGPSDILFDANDNMYVTAASIGRVLYYPPNATIGTIVVDGLPVTNGIAFNNDGELHMSVSGNSRVLKIQKELTKWVYETGTYTAEVTMDNGCSYNVGPINITSQVVTTRDTVRLSNCGNVYYNGINYSTSTTLRDTLRTTAGCDSIYRVTYILIQSIPNASINNGINVSLGTTLTLANAANAKQIDWYNNGIKVSTIHHASNIIPTIVAGGNGWGSANNQASYPYSVALDAAGNLYTVNTHFNSVEKWDMATNIKTIVAGSGIQNVFGVGLNQLNQPRGIFVDNSNNIFVADGENHRVVKWAQGASSGVVVAGGNGGWNNADQLNYPTAVFVDAVGNLYIADEFNNRIQKWSPGATSGVTIAGNFHFGSPIINATELNHPTGVFVKPNGDIYVADMLNHRVQKFAAGSSVATTVAGQADGTAGNDACHLHYPHALYVDANDNVFVADVHNNRVQKWTPGATSGITVAGGEGNSFTSGIDALAMNTNGDMFCGSVGASSVTKWVNSAPTINTTFTPSTTGNYYAVLTFDNCCQLTTNAVDVNAFRPGTPITGTPKSCTLNTTTTLKNATPNGVWTSSDASVAIVSQSGLVTSLSNGTTTISYKYLNNGDVYLSTINFIVASLPNPVIVGDSKVCVGSSITLSSTINGGVWSSVAGRATVDINGDVIGTSAGNATIRYTLFNSSGCSTFISKTIRVNPIPVVPTVAYALGTTNPQLGAPTGSFCVGRVFTVVGSPNVPAGTWSSTGIVGITNTGVVTIGSVGAGTISYTYTSAAGCSNSRTFSGNGFACAFRGVSVSGEGLMVSNDFTMYPNPAKGFINLNIETLVGAGSIVVTDLYGKSVKTQALSMGTNSVDIANLSKGMYFVSMITIEGKKTKKLVVE